MTDAEKARDQARLAQAELLKFSLRFHLWPREQEAVAAVLQILAQYADTNG